MSRPHTTLLVKEFLDQEGGLAGFADAWHRALVEAGRKAPGTKLVLDAYRQVMRLWLAANEESAAIDFKTMTEDEVREFVVDRLLSALVRDVCAEYGFRISGGQVIDAKSGELDEGDAQVVLADEPVEPTPGV